MKFSKPFFFSITVILLFVGPTACSASKKKEVSEKKAVVKKEEKKQKTPASVLRKSHLPKELYSLEREYKKKKTISAEFDQYVKTALMSQSSKGRHSKGRLWVKIPGKLRWEVSSPSKELIVLDGKKAYHYTPPFDEQEAGQVLIQDASRVKSKLADLILQGNFSKLSGVKFKRHSVHHFEMIPVSQGAGDLKKALFWIDSNQSHIQRLILETKQGSRTEIVLKSVQQGSPIEDRFFQFTPPPGVDVIRN